MKLLPLAAAALSAGALQAAQLVTLTGVDTSRGANVTFTINGNTQTGFAGVILGNVDGVPVSPLFCVDLFTGISLGTYNTNPLAPRPARNEDRVAWLYVNQLSTVVNQNTGLAFQLAIWDIIHDNGDGLSAGSVSTATFTGLTAAQIALINQYLTVSLGQSLLTGATIYQNSNRTTGAPAQDLIGASLPTPEPATGVLAAAGLVLVGAGALRRRIRR